VSREPTARPSYESMLVLEIKPHLFDLLKEMARKRSMSPDQLAELALDSFLRIQARKYVEQAIAAAELEIKRQ
jgi:hypothetical protein